jgi:hypothetical protein
MNPDNQVPPQSPVNLPDSQNPPQFTPPVQIQNTVPQPPPYVPLAQPISQDPPAPIPSKQFRFPMWPLKVLAVIALLISFLVSLAGYSGVQRDHKLSKVGKVTDGVVVSVQNSQIPDSTGANTTASNMVKTTTLVTYRMQGVPGYGTQQFTQAPAVQPGTVIVPGQHFQILYNPTNPGTNNLKIDVKSDQSSIDLYAPWLFFVSTLATVLFITVIIKLFARRARSIQTLSS